MQISNTPLKWTLPFAANDGAKVEIPATTADPTRFSLSLGSPPLTGQPPETGGVPPQLEDFNGAMNQISRISWWAMGGGPFPFDATWASNANVNGYPQGAKIRTADYQGDWISTVDNNTTNPDTVGTGWVPGYNYGTTALTGQTGGTTTLTPAQAVKRTLSIAGALTSNLTVILPTWLQEWTVTNTTTGAFTVTVKTAAGSGVVIPQDSSPTRVRGDGTNITQLAENIAAATAATHPMQLQQQGNSNAFTTYTTNQTLTAAQTGGVFRFLLSGTATVTLPAANALPSGSTYILHNSGASTALLTVASASTLVPITAPQINPGVSITFVNDATTNAWYATRGFSNANLATTTPWFTDPSGFIVQAGASSMSTTSVAITFPKPFPHGCLGVLIQRTGATNPTDANNTSADVVSTTGFTARSSIGNITFYWLAIGW